jgi:trafficking protein particle complex subunit 2
MEDLAVYGYITPLKVKIVIALALSDAVIRDIDMIVVRLSLTPHRLVKSQTHGD